MNIVLHMENGDNVKIDNVINRNVTNQFYQVICKFEDDREKEYKFKTSQVKFVTFA